MIDLLTHYLYGSTDQWTGPTNPTDWLTDPGESDNLALSLLYVIEELQDMHKTDLLPRVMNGLGPIQHCQKAHNRHTSLAVGAVNREPLSG